MYYKSGSTIGHVYDGQRDFESMESFLITQISEAVSEKKVRFYFTLPTFLDSTKLDFLSVFEIGHFGSKDRQAD